MDINYLFSLLSAINPILKNSCPELKPVLKNFCPKKRYIRRQIHTLALMYYETLGRVLKLKL